MIQAPEGLENVVVANTAIGLVDGQEGRLVYRGYAAEDIALNQDFESAAFLIWHGHLPDRDESATMREMFHRNRTLSATALGILKLAPQMMNPLVVLRSAFSLADAAWPPTTEQAVGLVAQAPLIIARAYRTSKSLPLVEDDPSLDHVENFLYMLHGKRPTTAQIRALQAYLILTMEHGMNASTFTARVVTSTQSDLISAVVAAISAMKGPLHGGAPSEVMTMIDEIGTKDNAETWIREKLEKGERLMGFGHRVYKTEDPRARALRSIVKSLAPEDPWFDLAIYVEQRALELLQEYKPSQKLYTNVEYWASAILRSVGIPPELFTPMFTSSRLVGWTAHIMEQAAHNRLIRPQSKYVGPEATN